MATNKLNSLGDKFTSILDDKKIGNRRSIEGNVLEVGRCTRLFLC